MLEPEDWNIAYSVSVFKHPLPRDYTATWRTVLRGFDTAEPQPTSAAVEDCVIIAQGLTTGSHVLELRGARLDEEVQAARFYAPPETAN